MTRKQKDDLIFAMFEGLNLNSRYYIFSFISLNTGSLIYQINDKCGRVIRIPQEVEINGSKVDLNTGYYFGDMRRILASR